MHELEALAIHVISLLSKEVNKVIGFNPGSLAKVDEDEEETIIKFANGEGFLKAGQVFSVDIDFGNDFQRLNHMDSPLIYNSRYQSSVQKSKKRLILNGYQANNWRSMELATLVLAYITASSKLEFEMDRNNVAPLSPPIPTIINSSDETIYSNDNGTEDEESVDSSNFVVNFGDRKLQKRKRTRMSRDDVQKQREVGYEIILERLSRNKHVPTKVVAEYLGHSMFHFHRCFLVYVGVTVQEYTNLCTKIYNKNKKTFLKIKKIIGRRTFKSIGVNSLLANFGESLKIMGSQIDIEPRHSDQLFTTDCIIIPEQHSARVKKAKLANTVDKYKKKHGSQDRNIRSKLIDANITAIAPFKEPQFIFEYYEQSFNDKIHSVSKNNTTPVKTPAHTPVKMPVKLSYKPNSDAQSVKLVKSKNKRKFDEFDDGFFYEPNAKKFRYDYSFSSDIENLTNEDKLCRYLEDLISVKLDDTSLHNDSQLGPIVEDVDDFLDRLGPPFDDVELRTWCNENAANMKCKDIKKEISPADILANISYANYNDRQQDSISDCELGQEFLTKSCTDFKELVLETSTIFPNDFAPNDLSEIMEECVEMYLLNEFFSISDSDPGYNDFLNLDPYKN